MLNSRAERSEWRVYVYDVNGVGQVTKTTRTEETFDFPEDAIPFRTLVLFRNRGWVIAPFYSPDSDGNTIYFSSVAHNTPCCELRRETQEQKGWTFKSLG